MKVKKFKEMISESKRDDFKYEFGCVMLKLDVPNWKKDVLSLINDEDIYDEDGFGLEENAHITLFFGVKPEVDYKDVVEKLKDYRDVPEYIELKNISIFETNDLYDVVKFDIDDKHEMLSGVHNYIESLFPNEKQFDYHPHCTVAYVKKGKGVNYIQDLDKSIVVKPKRIYYSYPKDNGNKKGNVDIINF